MKIKILALIAIVASVTLSFTFAQVTSKHKQEEVKNVLTGSEPAGGFVAIEITR